MSASARSVRRRSKKSFMAPCSSYDPTCVNCIRWKGFRDLGRFMSYEEAYSISEQRFAKEQ